MDYLRCWTSDGPQALAGLIVLGIVVQVTCLFLVRNTARLRRLVAASVLWHVIIYLFFSFWFMPFYRDGLDAYGYHHDAIYLAQFVRSASFGNIPFSLGTEAVSAVIAFIYAPFGGDVYGMLFFCTSIGLLSATVFCKAFAGTPASGETERLYFFFVLFWPSICLWSCLLGKDSIVTLGLALASLGTSRFLKSKHQQAVAPFLLGLTLVTLFRPHIALAVMIASAAAAMWPRAGSQLRNKGAVVAFLVMLPAIFAPIVMNFLAMPDLTLQNMEDIASKISEGYNIGGSAMGNSYGGIAGIPIGMMNLLIRPYPWEIQSLNTGLAAAENVLLVGLLALAARRIRQVWICLQGSRYLLFCTLLSLELLIILSPISNAGLASRERAQFLPFMLACLAPAGLRSRTP